MAIHYQCRHCKTKLGEIDQQVESNALGFDQLSSSERTDMVTYASNGDIHVEAICEDCHEALMRNPDLYELDHVIQ
ncbi:anti-sigma-F factor Fin family protein [Halalkalibacter akibai]|uniref:Fin: required for the switch from sigmaF to sigmaG during sporulation n=1 Tax=Halalkalibacter akibai (strain ATCC 43226 / DSM 21942 / CIP 109018 / JCM 9157 / 1139) TaxID=1236973 RepID=W4QWR9_HALA3|nr:anti-sigma-F factor Fin family protein [Halalkalibacter akibai]GAE36570.1 Fin: required for the switch from sigmaF to sigmaG during sporulation [Halalkalibacter akibai JCM 9157]